MTNSGDRHGEAEDALQSINKRTGRNMPQAVATGAVLVVVILASLLIRVDAFVVLIMIFMILGLWELRVDFATAGLHIPLMTLCLCSSASIVLTYYAPDHLLAMMLCVMATVLLVCLSASTRINMGNRFLSQWPGSFRIRITMLAWNHPTTRPQSMRACTRAE